MLNVPSQLSDNQSLFPFSKAFCKLGHSVCGPRVPVPAHPAHTAMFFLLCVAQASPDVNVEDGHSQIIEFL